MWQIDQVHLLIRIQLLGDQLLPGWVGSAFHWLSLGLVAGPSNILYLYVSVAHWDVVNSLSVLKADKSYYSVTPPDG